MKPQPFPPRPDDWLLVLQVVLAAACMAPCQTAQLEFISGSSLSLEAWVSMTSYLLYVCMYMYMYMYVCYVFCLNKTQVTKCGNYHNKYDFWQVYGS